MAKSKDNTLVIVLLSITGLFLLFVLLGANLNFLSVISEESSGSDSLWGARPCTDGCTETGSGTYITPETFLDYGRRVLKVGIGDSGCATASISVNLDCGVSVSYSGPAHGGCGNNPPFFREVDIPESCGDSFGWTASCSKGYSSASCHSSITYFPLVDCNVNSDCLEGQECIGQQCVTNDFCVLDDINCEDSCLNNDLFTDGICIPETGECSYSIISDSPECILDECWTIKEFDTCLEGDSDCSTEEQRCVKVDCSTQDSSLYESKELCEENISENGGLTDNKIIIISILSIIILVLIVILIRRRKNGK